ncbi:MAG: tRNA (adenosine(37)-N6)-threonylcarbamoyltransferase complex ATPase subunit type 1 TsaE [Bacteroidetes bacterium]|nr:MAG: tRNA (adenosine(37)-N6)-threonylcarbamoyltransferase complex ATPase subunit type 1 TsaE [Bacteroidota bacterium]RLD47454.1 MAG: tRNA (adenosine(37)-N6)-threonylcarbamoyltransferase complex ATPase subunit type 1 TsaE [Bacteroidota bacterium]RLD87285.1 MAG: tRNA (adenosine(37)-N6)-threonylcarbamoyltransferase complex ATPase subunit type 1 TsaE [Bacteroidota bacterium]
MKNQLVAHSVNDLAGIAEKILTEFKDQRIFAVKGKMGAGKTTLIKAFCYHLGVEETVSSPTFALVNEYTTASGESVFHFDFYRIKKMEEVFDIGYEEYFYSDRYCFIEWPELVEGLLPEGFVTVDISVGENEERFFSVTAGK